MKRTILAVALSVFAAQAYAASSCAAQAKEKKLSGAANNSFDGLIRDAEMLSPRFINQVKTALAYINAKCYLRTTFNRRRTSYGFKHAAERWGSENGMARYVTNGAFIVACLIKRVPMRRIPDDPNALFRLCPDGRHV